MRKYASPVFQHRHYALVAKVLADIGNTIGPDNAKFVALAFTNAFEGDNPHFDKERFYAAARGVPSNKKDERDTFSISYGSTKVGSFTVEKP